MLHHGPTVVLGSAYAGAAGAPVRTFASGAPKQSASPLRAASPETGGLPAWDLTGWDRSKSENTDED